MTQKPLQKTDQAPDFFQLLRQQHNPNQYMRFYLQQDDFTCHPLMISQQKLLIQQTTKDLPLKLFMNRLIFNAVSDVLIMNKFVYNNSKIMNTILQSGRDMILGKYIKKHINWVNFLQRKQLHMIKLAFESLSLEEQLRIEYSVLSISNLILKLGINISKLSCIVTQRKYTTALLSIPSLSVLFLQYLMYKLFESREIDDRDQEAKSQFIRQLPRITYIKLSQVINKSELMSLQIGQQTFFSSQTFKKVKNMQYLQFYEHQEQNGIRGYEQFTSYEYIKAINMRQMFGLKSCYGFQLLFLFRTVYFNVIKDFSPDVILFVEDYDSCKRVIEPQIRALLLTELMENVTGKVFVMREVGYRANFQYISTCNEAALQKHKEMSTQRLVKRQMAECEEMESEEQSVNSIQLGQSPNSSSNYNEHSPKKQRTFISPKEMQSIMMQKIETLNLMSAQVQQKLDYQENLIMGKSIAQYQLGLHKGPTCSDLFVMEKVLRDDLSYISLALIQRTSFEEVATRSHRHIYSEQFLRNIITYIYQYNLQLKQSYENKTELISRLQLSHLQMSEMTENIKLPLLTLYQDYFNSIVDLRTNKTYFLDVMGEDNQVAERLHYKDEDYLYVYYGQSGELVVVVFRSQNVTILKLCAFTNPIMNEEFYYWEPIVYEEGWGNQHLAENSSYLVTADHIYKAFGIPPNQQNLNTHSNIIRANYRQLILSNKTSRSKVTQKVAKQRMLINEQMMEVQSYNNVLLKFEEISTVRIQKEKKIDIPLLQKTYGWTIYDELTKNAIFMGGHSPQCAGENWVNKYLHILSEKQFILRQVGKTTNQLFLGVKNFKSKIPLYPFIYGLPFIIERTCYILSTNGFYENLTNSNKIFLTEFKLGTQLNDTKYGIISQRRLFVNYENDEERLLIITAKEFIVHYIVNSYNCNNSYQNRCLLQTVDEGMLELEIKVGEVIGGKQTVGMLVRTDRKEQNGFDEIKMYFSPLEL